MLLLFAGLLLLAGVWYSVAMGLQEVYLNLPVETQSAVVGPVTCLIGLISLVALMSITKTKYYGKTYKYDHAAEARRKARRVRLAQIYRANLMEYIIEQGSQAHHPDLFPEYQLPKLPHKGKIRRPENGRKNG